MRGAFDFIHSRIQIGNYLGLTVVHVNRMLRSLRDERIVNLKKDSVMILDLERLTRLAQNGGLVSPIAGVGERSLSDAAD